MKFIFISLAVLHGLVLTTVFTQQIKVRSHGDKQINAQKQDVKERTYEAVLGLNVSPRNRLRVRTRNPKDATDTLAAAEAAGIKAKEIRQKNRLSYRDLDSFETSLIPVYYSNGASPSSTSVKPPRLPGFRQAFTQTTTPAPLVASTAASSEYVSGSATQKKQSRIPRQANTESEAKLETQQLGDQHFRSADATADAKPEAQQLNNRQVRSADATADAEPEAQQQTRSYSHYSSNGRTGSGSQKGSGDVRRTFHVHRGVRHQGGRGPPNGGYAPTSPPAPPPPPVTTSYASTTTSNPSLYYFKAVDSTVSSVKTASQTSSQSSTAYSAGLETDNDNLALPGGYQPTYVVYPTTSSPGPNPSQSYSSQKYLKPNKKPTFRPAGSYDAPKSPSKTSSQSIYRDDTSKFHPASLVHLPKPTSSYGVPPVQIADEDIRPRGTSGKRPPVFGYYPPAQRVMPRVNHMEAECSDDVMKLRVKFNDTFSGLIYSAGYSYDTDCIYINGTGVNEYEFYIQLNRCGTLGGSDHNKKRDAKYKNTEPTKNYMWNTVTIQYNPLIEEEWDEHFKVTCEYGYDFWKTVTFPFLDVEVNTADPVHFTLTPPECHMEIRNGYGTTGARVAGPVHVGDPLTLMILMRSAWDGFDIVVNDCFAHNGANKRIPLIDHHGCPVDEKLISRFQGTWGMTNNQYDTLVYAHMKTFRFTGTPALYIECDIRMCHGKCPQQPCNWRTPKQSKKRTRRETNELNPEDLKLLNKSLSESVNLFQSIHVLQSKEDELAFGNETSAEPLYDEVDSICVGSVVFAGVIGSMAFVALMSSVIVSLLCLKMKRLKDTEASVDNQLNTKDVGVRRAAFIPGSGANSIASLETLRSRATIKSEYVHSAQARIP